MRMIRGALPFTFLTIVMSMPVAATAATPGEVCAAAKLKATGKYVAASLACVAKATKAGAVADSNCTAKAFSTLTNALAKAEARGGCAPGGDLPSALSGMHSIVFLLRPVTTANRCASSKIKAAGKKAKAKLACHAKAAARGLTIDPTCLAKAEARFAAAFASAETRPPCLTTGDAPIIENVVDDLVTDVVAAIPTNTTTTTTTTSTTTTFIPGICGNGVLDQPDEDCDPPSGLDTCVPGVFACRAPGEPGECTCCGDACSSELGVGCCDPLKTCVDGPGPIDACEACSPAGQACTNGPLGPGCCPGALCIEPPGICIPQ